MLHKCANSSCLTLFRHLSQGKLFQVETAPREVLTSMKRAKMTRRRQGLPTLEYFWLCDDCAPVFTLIFTKTRAPVAVPLRSKKGEIDQTAFRLNPGGDACMNS